MERVCSSLLIALGCALSVSCQQQSGSAGSRTYPDAVVSLNQVDPMYRPYFAAQNGSNYSLADQRAAFIKAAQTAKGPLPSYVASSPGTRTHRKGKSVALKGSIKKGSVKKGAVKKGTAAKSTSKKSATKTSAKKKKR